MTHIYEWTPSKDEEVQDQISPATNQALLYDPKFKTNKDVSSLPRALSFHHGPPGQRLHFDRATGSPGSRCASQHPPWLFAGFRLAVPPPELQGAGLPNLSHTRQGQHPAVDLDQHLHT